MDRSEARAAALKLIYENRMGGTGGPDTIQGLLEIGPKEGNSDYMEALFKGVCENESRYNDIISKYLRSGWRIDRLSMIDLIVLQIGLYELEQGELTAGIIINEAIELAGSYSNPDITPFINGVLANIARDDVFGKKE